MISSRSTDIPTMQFISTRAYAHLTNAGFGDWALTVDDKAIAVMSAAGLTPIETIQEGLMGAVIICANSEGKRIVLKLAPPQETANQMMALLAMDDSKSPTVLQTFPEQDAFTMEYLQATALPKEAIVRPFQVVELISSWANKPAPSGLKTSLELIETWVREATAGGQPPQLQDALIWAEEVAQSLPQGHQLLHGDLGRHNLMIDANEDLIAIDPKGIAGSVEFEIGLASVWCPSARSNSIDYAQEISAQMNADATIAKTWMKIRAAVSAGSGYNRGEMRQYEDCLNLYNRISL